MSDRDRELAKTLRDDLNRKKSDRANYDNIWDVSARLVLPTSVGFTSTYAPGTYLHNEIYDTTAIQALPKFAAALDTLLTPQHEIWHSFQPEDPRLKRDEPTRAFYYWLTQRLFQVRYQPRANFAARMGETYISLGAFGNGVIYTQDARPGIRYLGIHLSEFWWDQDINGVIDTAYWEHEYTARQVLQNEAWAKKLPEDFAKLAKDRPDQKFKVVKAVYPRTDRGKPNAGAKSMKFANTVFLSDGQTEPVILEESGYRTFPFAVMRYLLAPRELYGRGPTQEVLGSIRSLQRMKISVMRRGELSNDPAWLTADEDSLPELAARPGSINPGYLGPDGKPRAVPLYVPGDGGIGLELMDQERQAIYGAYLVTLFQAMAETSDTKRMTATEVTARMQEKGAMLAPIGGRIRSEFLGALIERELDILIHAGLLDGVDIPDGVKRSNGTYKVVYESMLSRNVRSEASVGILRTLETASQIAQATGDPKVYKNIDLNKAFWHIADGNNTPPDVIVPADQLAAEDEALAQQQEMAMALQAAPGLADTAKTLVEANNMAGTDTGVV